MARASTVNIQDIKDRIVRNLTEHGVRHGSGDLGEVTASMARRVTRTFRAHWTGFKIFYPKDTVLLRADTKDGTLWAEAYISTSQPSWVLTFRSSPHPSRGSSGRPRPDDELSAPQQVETALGHRRRLVETGLIPPEELIRMEDFDDPLQAVDGFFNYTSFYVLKAMNAGWGGLGFMADASLQLQPDESGVASVPIDAAIAEGLKKSDIIWVQPNTASRAVPCWFVLKDAKAYVLSGEPQQVVPNAERVRNARVVARWKGRDAALAEFDAAVRVISARDPEFDEIGELMVAKRQSVTGDAEENISRWKRDCVILELTPRA